MSDIVDDMMLHFGDDMHPEWRGYIPTEREKYSIKDNKDYWVTRAGQKIYPHEMKESHIRNTITLIKRNCSNSGLNPTDYKIYNLLVEELNKR